MWFVFVKGDDCTQRKLESMELDHNCSIFYRGEEMIKIMSKTSIMTIYMVVVTVVMMVIVVVIMVVLTMVAVMVMVVMMW